MLFSKQMSWCFIALSLGAFAFNFKAMVPQGQEALKRLEQAFETYKKNFGSEPNYQKVQEILNSTEWSDAHKQRVEIIKGVTQKIKWLTEDIQYAMAGRTKEVKPRVEELWKVLTGYIPGAEDEQQPLLMIELLFKLFKQNPTLENLKRIEDVARKYEWSDENYPYVKRIMMISHKIYNATQGGIPPAEQEDLDPELRRIISRDFREADKPESKDKGLPFLEHLLADNAWIDSTINPYLMGQYIRLARSFLDEGKVEQAQQVIQLITEKLKRWQQMFSMPAELLAEFEEFKKLVAQQGPAFTAPSRLFKKALNDLIEELQTLQFHLKFRNLGRK